MNSQLSTRHRCLTFKAGSTNPVRRWHAAAAPKQSQTKPTHVTRATNRLEEQLRKEEADRVNLRSEAEAPFRSLRVFFYGTSVVSALVGTLVSIPQLIGAMNGAANSMAQQDVLQNLGINLGAVTIFGLLLRQEFQARDKQIARLQREERLGSLWLKLSSGKNLQLAELRGSIRAVVLAGSEQQIRDALAAAEPYKEKLIQRGVFVITAPLSSASADASSSSADASSTAASSAPSAEADASNLRWVARAKRTAEWEAWFQEQLALAKGATGAQGLFVGLRLDGRVRASGQGCPPWARFAAELAPIKGDNAWTGFFDGFDGRV